MNMTVDVDRPVKPFRVRIVTEKHSLTDRGPYARGVSYDLTEATARKLGVTQTTRLAAAPLDQ